MSGRIRTLKPEILEDAVTAGLSDMAFRIFASVILLAEDSGRFRAEPGWLMGQIYWRRPVPLETFVAAIGELVEARLILLYEASGQRYGVVRTWAKHQKISHAAAPRLPSPPWGEGNPPEALAASSGGPPEDLRSLSALIPIPIPIPTPTTDRSADPEPETQDPGAEAAPGPTPPASTGVRRMVDQRPDEVWQHYVTALRAHRPHRHPGSLRAADRKAIADLLRDGYAVADLRLAVDGLLRSPHHLGNNDRGTEYLEICYALRKPATMIALADDRGPPVAHVPAPPPGELLPPAVLAQRLADMERAS